jgi:hypothetical protein
MGGGIRLFGDDILGRRDEFGGLRLEVSRPALRRLHVHQRLVL